MPAEPGAWSNASSMTLPQGLIAEDGTCPVSIEGIFISLSLFAPFITGVSMVDDTTTTDDDTGDGTDVDTDGDGTGDGQF